MPPRIAIPMPHSLDHNYAERAMPQYELAVDQAGGEPVRISLEQTNAAIRKILETCDAVLLPGSNADVDPARFGGARSPHTAPADPRRDAVDNLLLQDAYDKHKPILGICYGLQSLNVYRSGSLVQHIPDFLPEDLRTRVDHEAGKAVPVAHRIEIAGDSRLARIVSGIGREGRDFRSDARLSERSGPKDAANETLVKQVNSSHHQAADLIGSGLSIAARCPDDGIIEALEGAASDHFVLAVQWHPERSVEFDEASRAIFRALVDAAKAQSG